MILGESAFHAPVQLDAHKGQGQLEFSLGTKMLEANILEISFFHADMALASAILESSFLPY